MKKFTSNDEIENLCEAMIKDFFKSKHYDNCRSRSNSGSVGNRQ